MTKTQIMDAIRLMQPEERLEIMEYTVRLMREEVTETAAHRQLNLADAAKIMLSYYTEGSELTEFSDLGEKDFYEYKEYV
jgi:hypothetical protein